MTVSTMARCRDPPSRPAGAGRNRSKPNQRFSSFFGSWRSRHQRHSRSAQATSRSNRTSRPRLRELVAHPGRHHRIARRTRRSRRERMPSPSVGARPSPGPGAPAMRMLHRPGACESRPVLPHPTDATSPECHGTNDRGHDRRCPGPACSASATTREDRIQPRSARSTGHRILPAPGGRPTPGHSAFRASVPHPGSASRDGDRGCGERRAG